MLNVLNSVALALDYRLNFLSRAINKSGEPIDIGNFYVNNRFNHVSLTRQHGFKVKGGQLPLVFFGINCPRNVEKVSVENNKFIITSGNSKNLTDITMIDFSPIIDSKHVDKESFDRFISFLSKASNIFDDLINSYANCYRGSYLTELWYSDDARPSVSSWQLKGYKLLDYKIESEGLLESAIVLKNTAEWCDEVDGIIKPYEVERKLINK